METLWLRVTWANKNDCTYIQDELSVFVQEEGEICETYEA